MRFIKNTIFAYSRELEINNGGYFLLDLLDFLGLVDLLALRDIS